VRISLFVMNDGWLLIKGKAVLAGVKGARSIFGQDDPLVTEVAFGLPDGDYFDSVFHAN